MSYERATFRYCSVVAPFGSDLNLDSRAESPIERAVVIVREALLSAVNNSAGVDHEGRTCATVIENSASY